MKPGIQVTRDELVIVQMRIRPADTVDLGKLPRARALVFIQAPETFEKPLSAQDLMQTGDAAPEAVRRVKEGGVAIRDLDPQAHELRRGVRPAAAFQQFHGRPRPDRPVAEQASDDAPFHTAEPKGRQKIGDDAVVVARVERDVITAGSITARTTSWVW